MTYNSYIFLGDMQMTISFREKENMRTTQCSHNSHVLLFKILKHT